MTGCARCRHFDNDPARMEAACPGLATLSSGWASVRAWDGLCDRRDIWVRFNDCCAEYTEVGRKSLVSGGVGY